MSFKPVNFMISFSAPEWFNEAFTSKIKADVISNWRLKASNLKKIVEAIVDYYQECLNQHLVDFKKPDINQIGKHTCYRGNVITLFGT